jgi:hypothetical protein
MVYLPKKNYILTKVVFITHFDAVSMRLRRRIMSGRLAPSANRCKTIGFSLTTISRGLESGLPNALVSTKGLNGPAR